MKPPRGSYICQNGATKYIWQLAIQKLSIIEGGSLLEGREAKKKKVTFHCTKISIYVYTVIHQKKAYKIV